MMRTRILVGALLVVGLLGTGTFTTNGNGVGPAKRWATVSFDEPTRVGDVLLYGSYLIVHDDALMAQGKPCTTLYRFDPKKGPREQLITFMCVPTSRPLAANTIVSIHRTVGLSTATFEGYQFAGETERHGVPRNLR